MLFDLVRVTAEDQSEIVVPACAEVLGRDAADPRNLLRLVLAKKPLLSASELLSGILESFRHSETAQPLFQGAL